MFVKPSYIGGPSEGLRDKQMTQQMEECHQCGTMIFYVKLNLEIECAHCGFFQAIDTTAFNE